MTGPINTPKASPTLYQPSWLSFAKLSRVLRDENLEQRLEIELAQPSPDILESIYLIAQRASERIGARLPDLSLLTQPVLVKPLTPEEQRLVDEYLVPHYSLALEEDETPREEIPLKECMEVMVSLSKTLSDWGAEVTFSATPYHKACGTYAGKPRIFWCRKSVADKFSRFVLACNSNDIIPHVEDVYRPIEVQRGLFRRRYALIQENFPDWGPKDWLRETRAKTAATPFKAAHMGGAAIDVTLRRRGGTPLPLGNEYPMGGARAVLACPYVTPEEWHTRMVFALLSDMCGLAPYPGEDWHVSFGDGLATLMQGQPEIRYGPIRSFDPQSGVVTPFESDAMHEIFTLRGES